MADGHAGPQATHAGDSGPGQQDGEDRLNAHGTRRILQSSGRGGVNRHGLRSSGGRKVRREVWRNGQRRDRENQGTSERLERAKSVWTRSAISIQASGSERPQKQAGHTEAPEPARLALRNFLHPKGRPHTVWTRSAISLQASGSERPQ